MKKQLILFCILFSTSIVAVAQKDANPELQIPSMPGMIIIGVQNAEITKPGNYTGVYTNLISPILTNNGTIPTDLALEFSPYYLESRDLIYTELENTNLYRDLKISIASNQVKKMDSGFYSRMGFGFRTNLLNGKINNRDKDSITLGTANEINNTIFKIESGFYGNIDTADVALIIEKITDKALKEKVENIIVTNRENKDDVIKILLKLGEKIEMLIKTDGSRWDYSLRTGHFVEISGAFSLDFPRNTIDFSKINRWGIWLNYTYRPELEKQSIDFSAIIRLSNYSFDPVIVFEKETVFGDIGISINWHIPESKFVISGEFIGKAGLTDLKASDIDGMYTFKHVTESKWNASIGYQISNTVLWSVSLSDVNGNSDYLANEAVQLLMGLSAALVPLKK